LGRSVRLALLIAAVVASTVAFAGPAQARAGTTFDVFPGDSIQTAINAASPGDTIVVHPGVYHESLLIKKDDITLSGSGASAKGTVLESSKSPTKRCMKGGSGICVFASKSGGPVSGVRVSGFLVRGFHAFGLVGFGVQNTWVTHNAFVDNGEYGASTFASTGTHLLYNTASGSGEAGFYLGDTPKGNFAVRGNEAFGNTQGIFLRDSAYGNVVDNDVHGNCIGIIVLDTGAPTTAGHYTIHDNQVHQNDKFCPAQGGEEGAPALSGIGIAIVGGADNKVYANKVWANKPSHSGTFMPGGIVLVSSKHLAGGAVETGNKVTANQAYHNHEVDIAWDRKGHNTFKKNKCDFSDPGGLCH
jgi:parallel beta-helix repeat protein